MIGEDTICLISFWVALEAVQGPISPVNVSFFEVLDEIVPRNVLRVIAILSEKVRNSQSSHKGLRVK